MGAKYGLGWYVNWQKEMMAYSNVYAGLILIAGSFCLFMELMFKLRNRVLAWQKGVINGRRRTYYHRRGIQKF